MSLATGCVLIQGLMFLWISYLHFWVWPAERAESERRIEWARRRAIAQLRQGLQ